MEKQQLINKVKQLTGAANLDQALDLLDKYATSNLQKYDDLHDQIVQAQAQLSQTQKDLNAGVISFENAKLSLNQVTRQILDILNELEEEEKKPGKPPRRKLPVWLIPSILIVLLSTTGGILWFYSQHEAGGPDDPDKPQVTKTSYCPGFEGVDAAFKVLILPYLYWEKPLGSHDLIRLRLGQLRDQYQIQLEGEVYGDTTLASNRSQYPANSEQAAVFGEKCIADMVIWGAEEATSNENVIITNYKFVGDRTNFDLTQLKITDTGVDTIQTLSSILTQGAVTGEVEQVIKYIFGLIKFEAGEYDDAIAALEEAQIEETDSSAILAKNMILSDSYFKTGKEEKALQSLDNALVTHPEYALARNNRAAIYYTKEKFTAAAADLEVANSTKPDDETIVANRLFLSLAMDNVAKAKESWRDLERITPKNRDLAIKTPIIDSSINLITRKNETIIQTSKTVLESNPRNIEAQQQQAEAHLKLNQFSDAINVSRKILRQDPKNKIAYLVLLESYIKLKRERETIEVLKKARDNGINEKDLFSERPDIKRLVEGMKKRIG